MNQRLISAMFSLIKYELGYGAPLSKDESAFVCDNIEFLYKLSKKHDLSHMVWDALTKHKKMIEAPEWKDKFEKDYLLAMFRYERINFEFCELCSVFEKEKIPFIPLKGAVIRKYYSEPWMRTSSDIDFLVKVDDIEKIKSVIDNTLEIKYKSTWHHEHSFFTPNGVHIEFHDDLNPYDDIKDNILENVWKYVKKEKNLEYRFKMSDEMFYYYHIAHMAKHFEHGGCGIRPFIDLWILDNLPESDEEKRNALLQRGNLLKFANSARKLSRVWFANEEHDLISKQMEDYILHGGVYGNIENRVIVQQQKKGGRIKYVISKIFIPYDIIKVQYPILKKHRWLTPFMEVRRWCKLIFCGHLKRAAKELRYNNNVSSSDAENIKLFLENIGL